MHRFATFSICISTFIRGLSQQASAQAPASSTVTIQVDLAKTQGPYRPIYSWFGYDESNYTTMKYGRQRRCCIWHGDAVSASTGFIKLVRAGTHSTGNVFARGSYVKAQY